MQDGQPTTLLAGNLHYFRIPPEYWADRLDRAAAAGLTAIEVYIPWNWHKPRRDEPADFSSDWRDIAKYFSLAAERGMRVLLRPGERRVSETPLSAARPPEAANGKLMFELTSRAPPTPKP